MWAETWGRMDSTICLGLQQSRGRGKRVIVHSLGVYVQDLLPSRLLR